jgi:16S rRNA (uracil1498-N3)-methyltransferase
MARHIPRVYLKDVQLFQDAEISLTDLAYHHLANVLRVKINASVFLFNSQNGEWLGKITSITKHEIHIHLSSQSKTITFSPPTILYFSPIRKERQIELLEKATELGVTELQPIITTNTTHKLLAIEKIESYLTGAAEQSGRCNVPKIHEPVSFSKLQNVLTHPLYIAVETSTKILSGSFSSSEIHLAVGPEGGWSEDEIQSMKGHAHINTFSLGNLVLRSETAVVASLSLFNYLRSV